MTYKTTAIESIFFARWNATKQELSNPIVSLLDIQRAQEEYNAITSGKKVSTRNPANFFKDLVRNQKRANNNWPPKVLAQGYTGRQLQSDGNCFEFIRIANGQTEAFPIDVLPMPDANTPRIKVESVSLPLASKRLGRKDEPWLIQVLVRLRVFETHLALSSSQSVVQLDHLQTNLKLKDAEIDALFLAVRVHKGQQSEAIVCCEAKSRRDDIVPHQILNQVRAAFRMGITQDAVIPLAVKAIAPSEVWIVEFEPVTRETVANTDVLTVAMSAIYELVPPVPGIGK